jgi:hypothetical protein
VPGEVNLPRPTAIDEGLHKRLFGLYQMHQIMPAPFMQQIAQADLA